MIALILWSLPLKLPFHRGVISRLCVGLSHLAPFIPGSSDPLWRQVLTTSGVIQASCLHSFPRTKGQKGPLSLWWNIPYCDAFQADEVQLDLLVIAPPCWAPYQWTSGLLSLLHNSSLNWIPTFSGFHLGLKTTRYLHCVATPLHQALSLCGSGVMWEGKEYPSIKSFFCIILLAPFCTFKCRLCTFSWSTQGQKPGRQGIMAVSPDNFPACS